jgi:hypothetical protein
MDALDNGVKRIILKLVVVDASERWSAAKCLQSTFFKAKDDTTRMANSTQELGRAIRSMAGACGRLLLPIVATTRILN